MNNRTDLYIGFWVNESNEHMKTSAKGLSQEQVDALKKLKPGDRLIMFKGDSENPKAPHFTLKRFNPPPRETEGGL